MISPFEDKNIRDDSAGKLIRVKLLVSEEFHFSSHTAS